MHTYSKEVKPAGIGAQNVDRKSAERRQEPGFFAGTNGQGAPGIWRPLLSALETRTISAGLGGYFH